MESDSVNVYFNTNSREDYQQQHASNFQRTQLQRLQMQQQTSFFTGAQLPTTVCATMSHDNCDDRSIPIISSISLPEKRKYSALLADDGEFNAMEYGRRPTRQSRVIISSSEYIESTTQLPTSTASLQLQTTDGSATNAKESAARQTQVADPFAPECSIPLPFQIGDEYGYAKTPIRYYGPTSIWKRNERERHRVRCVNDGYEKLRNHLPLQDSEKRLSKVETLKLAIRYIKHLELLLKDESHIEQCNCNLYPKLESCSASSGSHSD